METSIGLLERTRSPLFFGKESSRVESLSKAGDGYKNDQTNFFMQRWEERDGKIQSR